MVRRRDGEGGIQMKNIIAVAAVITVVTAIVLIAFSSTVSAESVKRTYTDDGGDLWYEEALKSTIPKNAGNKPGFYEGEIIRFWDNTSGKFTVVKVSGPYKSDGNLYDEHDEYDVSAGDFWDAEGKPTKGYFKVVDGDENGGWFTVRAHSFEMELAEERTKVQEGEEFSLRLKENKRDQGRMKLTIEDDEGYSIMNENLDDIYEIGVNYKNELEFFNIELVGGIIIKADKLVFNASELHMKEGKYTIIMEDNATEVETKVNIEVEKKYLNVECDEEVVKGEDIVIIIKSSFYEKEVNVTVEGIPKWEEKTLTLDEKGKKKVRISTENEDCGTYKVTVKVCDFDMKETKYVKIKKSGTSLEVPENATVGDIVHIEGTSDFGDFAVFLVDDIFKKEARISADKFEWDWDTEKELDGYHGIDVFILSKVKHAEFSANYSIGDVVDDEWQRRAGVDASASIFLFLPEFSMTVLKNIAKGDDIVISGTVIGAYSCFAFKHILNYKRCEISEFRSSF